MENKLLFGSVEVTKYDEKYPDHKLTGAEFVVYVDTDGNGAYDVGEDVNGMTLTEVEEGHYVLEGLGYGKYLLKETKAPEGYVLDDNYYSFEIVKDGEPVEVSNTEVGEGFYNKPTQIRFLKVNEYREPMVGVVLQVFDKDGNAVTDPWVSTAAGKVIDCLTIGETYYLREIKKPDNYVLAEDVAFIVQDTAEVQEVVMQNMPIYGNVDTTKIDADYPDNKLSGAKFAIYVDMDKDGKYTKGVDTLYYTFNDSNQDGKFTAGVDSDYEPFPMFEVPEEPGYYLCENLPYGKYLLKEIVAPEGYVLDENYYPFSIEENGKTVSVTNTEFGKGFINNLKGKVGLYKFEKTEDGKYISATGAKFEVYVDQNGNKQFDEGENVNGIALVESEIIDEETGRTIYYYSVGDLAYGDYLLKETKAPEGCAIDPKYYAFTLSAENKYAEIENSEFGYGFINEQTVVTGDNEQIFLWMVFAAIGLAGVAVISAQFGKSKKHKSTR